VWRSLQIIGKQGVTFLIFILCAKILTPYDFGIYNYVIAIIFFLIMFGDFGISTATSKYVAEYNATDKKKLNLVVFNSGVIILGLTILIAILTLIIGPWYLKDKYIYILYLLPLIFLAPMTSFYDGIYRGLKKFKQLALISLLIGFISVFFVYYLVDVYGLIGALISQNLFYLVFLIGLGLGYKNFRLKLNKAIIKEISSYSLAIGVAITGYYLFSRVTVLILGHYNYINEIAVYELLNKIFTALLVPFTILGTIITPNLTEIYIQKNYKKILSKFKKYFLIFLFTAFIFAILFYLILPPIFSIFFKEYNNHIFSAMLIPVILIYSSLIYCTVINHGIIVATGHVKILTYSNVLLGISNIFLSLILLNYFGFIGVIYSVSILHIISVIIYHPIYYYKIKDLLAKNG
jgi:O-antigen/teichoic acid export membrane protein